MKNFLCLILVLLIVAPFGGTSFAESFPQEESLTEDEIKYLLEVVGHTQAEIENLPVEVAKELVNSGAIVQGSHSQLEYFYEPLTDQKSDFLPMATIPASELRMGATVYQVTSDRSGFKKFYFYGNWEWLKKPFWTLTDVMTIGWPVSREFSYPVNNSTGQVTQHQHRHCTDRYGNGKWECHPIRYTPYDSFPDAGVAASYNLVTYSDFTKYKGFISQYAYVPISATGGKLMNVKFEYGHRIILGIPSIGVYPAGLGIAPEVRTDTRAFNFELRY